MEAFFYNSKTFKNSIKNKFKRIWIARKKKTQKYPYFKPYFKKQFLLKEKKNRGYILTKKQINFLINKQIFTYLLF